MGFNVRESFYPQDAAKMWSVWSWVYRLKPPEEPFEEKDSNERWYLAEQDGEAVAACTVKEYRVVRGQADLSCGGVAGVATLSQHRGKGHGTELMVQVLRMMREAGQVVSSLYAFRDPFYAKVGYGTCGWRWKIVAPMHRFPKTDLSLPARQIAPDEIETVNGVHEGFVRGFSGSPIRGKQEWTDRLGKTAPLIYAVGDPIEAYAWVKITEFWGNVDVGEIAWSTPRGYDSIMAVLRGIAHNQKTMTWMEPPNSRFLALHFDQGVEMSIYRQTMHRVLDVPQAVEKLKPQGKGELAFAVHDPHIAENDGAWRATWSDGKVCTERAPRGDVAFSIGAFSQAFMGAPSVRELAHHGLIEVREAKALEQAERLFTPMPVCCMEFF